MSATIFERPPRRCLLIDQRFDVHGKLPEWAFNADKRIAESLNAPSRYDFHEPISTSGYSDLKERRNLEPETQRMRDMVAEIWRQYRNARRYPAAKGHGGSCHAPPVALVISNYGYGVYADFRRSVTAAFDRPAIRIPASRRAQVRS